MIDRVFTNLYRRLNPEQREAVDAIEGPVMVVAGPGTGKTEVLTLRIAAILRKTDTPPEGILALTFTDSGVYSMRRRLVEIVGSDAYRVTIATFHGFANEVIRSNPGEFPGIVGSVHIPAIEQIKILEAVIKDMKLPLLKPFGDPLFYLYPLSRAIGDLKKDAITPDDLEKEIHTEKTKLNNLPDLLYEKGVRKGTMRGIYRAKFKDIAKIQELSRVYRAYQKALDKEKFYDYDDMIAEVVRALTKSEDLRLTLQETYLYVLADEHQDANRAQNKLLELLASFHDPYPNLFIVGDEKQAIFRFQGASLENFLYFQRQYPKAKLVTLRTNYRSTQPLLGAAGSMIARSGARVLGAEVSLVAARDGKGEGVLVYPFSAPEHEVKFLSADITQELAKGTPFGEIAVLYRDNKDAAPIAAELSRQSIPFVIESAEDVLSDLDIVKLVMLLTAVNSFGADEKVLAALHLDFLGIPSLDIFRIAALRSKSHLPIVEIIHSKRALTAAGVSEFERVLSFARNLSAWHKASKNKNLTELIELVTEESGFLEHVISRPDAFEKLEKIDALFSEARSVLGTHRSFTLADFLAHLDLLAKYRLFSSTRSAEGRFSRVHLMTAHRAKGLEFDVVYITGATDTHWGGRRRSVSVPLPRSVGTAADSIDDERRLFYVALTRARRKVAVTYSQKDWRGKDLLPVQFVEEIAPEMKRTVPTEEIERLATRSRLNLKKKPLRAPIHSPLQEREYLNSLFFERGLSVTALNNYLMCPWRYFYVNLLRVPEAKGKHQMYGTAIHATLKEFFDALHSGRDIGKKELLEIFSGHLRREPLSRRELIETLSKGKRSLRGYYDRYRKEWSSNSINEFEIRGVLLDGKIPLTGTLDKIEFLDTAGHVNVVDYKTGRPRSRGMIEGKTKSGDGGYKRQLVFYKLLLDRYAKGKYTMVSGEIDFIEPDAGGKFRKERFIIEAADVLALEEAVRRVSKEILSLSFWSQRCEDKECRYCRLAGMKRPRSSHRV